MRVAMPARLNSTLRTTIRLLAIRNVLVQGNSGRWQRLARGADAAPLAAR